MKQDDNDDSDEIDVEPDFAEALAAEWAGRHPAREHTTVPAGEQVQVVHVSAINVWPGRYSRL